MNLPDTTDNNLGNYSLADIPIEDVENLKSIANVRLNEKVSKITKLLIYPETPHKFVIKNNFMFNN